MSYYTKGDEITKIRSTMNTYKCFKEVQAMKILGIIHNLDGSFIIQGPEEDVVVSKEYIDKHIPLKGGYYVKYADGYESFSPAKAFEEGYKLVE